MANKQIKDLTAATGAALTDKHAIDDVANLTKYVTMSQMRDFLMANLPNMTGIGSLQFDTAAGTPSYLSGKIFWDEPNKTVGVMTENGVIVQLGQQQDVLVKNETGATIANGKPVYVTGTSAGGHPLVSLAAASTIGDLHVPGLTTESIANGATGFVTMLGIVNDIDTSSLSTGTVYLGTTAGSLTNTDPAPTYPSIVVGQVLKVGLTDGQILVFTHNGTNILQTLSFSMPLRSVVDSALNLTGEFRTVASGLTANYSTPFAVSNNHVFILVNSISGTGDITISGATIDESTSVISSGQTEVLAVDASTNQYWQTSAKFIEVSGITIGPGITAIDYDVGVIGYTDVNNQSFELLGYRLDMFAQGNSPDIRFLIYKVKDDGGGKNVNCDG